MIYFNINLRNPWSNTFKNLWSRDYTTPFKNKFIELELYQSSSILSLMINCTNNQSHAGLDIEIGLLGYAVRFNLYDNRHWDYDTGKYEVTK